MGEMSEPGAFGNGVVGVTTLGDVASDFAEPAWLSGRANGLEDASASLLHWQAPSWCRPVSLVWKMEMEGQRCPVDSPGHLLDPVELYYLLLQPL